MDEAFEKRRAHRRTLDIVSRIRAVEGFITEREVGDDVAFDAEQGSGGPQLPGGHHGVESFRGIEPMNDV